MDQRELNKRAILDDLLVCPLCRTDLKDTEEQYVCLKCHRTYPVIDHIPRFLTDLSRGEQQVKRSFHFEQMRYLDSRHLRFRQELVEQWLQDVQLPRDYFKGKLVLDAGCGSGRWTYAMALLGATVVAVDFTEGGVQVTHQATTDMGNVAVIQANILFLPFKHERFDFVVSWGVLHHTPNTKSAFERLVPLVNKQGQLYVMVYEKHNPLKFFFTNLIRRVLRMVSEERRYRICRWFVIQNPILLRLLRDRIICSLNTKGDDPLEISTLQLGLYDAYSPVFNHLHSRQEVETWFREYHLEQICLTKPVRFINKKDITLNGECGGSINMRGVRT